MVEEVRQPIIVDLFKALGANPTAVNSNEIYTAAQTHLVDGCASGLGGIQVFRLYEVQKYISITNHAWYGEWLVMNGDSWNRLPPDLQAILSRNVTKYVLLERRSVALQTESIVDKLKRRGMVFNVADTAGMSIFDSGTITGTGGTAIQFGGGVNTLTLGPGFAINGVVIGSGSDAFQLGGSSGSGTFDVSTIGPQYQGFALLNGPGTPMPAPSFATLQSDRRRSRTQPLPSPGPLRNFRFRGGRLRGTGLIPPTTVAGPRQAPVLGLITPSPAARGASVTSKNILRLALTLWSSDHRQASENQPAAHGLSPRRASS